MITLLRGLKMAKDSGLWPCEVEIDTQTIVNLIESPGSPLSDIGLVIKDIELFLESSPACTVAFIPRSANMVAHSLAKLGLSVDNDCFSEEDYPPVVVLFLLGDCLSLM
ncbi:hypothetical protein Dsin_002815 [Dipteronia sinensis]|uniref:RNase H type-1 domain-containing protein n=1 Tax=Dipteronia sinensis TaxID=43782 RepID=A0AAE0EK16_9ROSI|nr:hypothetical protein Dsin_002815 [Dipteronia sinensis]